jgi:hypothetical protein
MGLNVFLQKHGSEDEIGIPSKTDPEHYFKIGYFRSSYNNVGIECVIHYLIGKSPLHEIFQPSGDHQFTPDWRAALERCDQIIAEVEAALDTDRAKYTCYCVSAQNLYANEPKIVTSDAEALDVFLKEKKDRESRGASFSTYSNLSGEFIFSEKPLNVRALLRGVSVLQQPALYVVYENEDDRFDWYVKALRIVKETIQYVLDQPDPDTYELIWSS